MSWILVVPNPFGNGRFVKSKCKNEFFSVASSYQEVYNVPPALLCAYFSLALASFCLCFAIFSQGPYAVLVSQATLAAPSLGTCSVHVALHIPEAYRLP